MAEGAKGLTRDKTRRSGKQPLLVAIVLRVVGWRDNPLTFLHPDFLKRTPPGAE